jgi:acid phosphatase class B
MTGKNSLLGQDPSDYYDLITASLDLSKIEALHLDVEPHTLDDWKGKKSIYLDQYIELLDRTNAYCDNRNINLSVSVPLHYPKEYLDMIYERCDKIYFMAYENIDTDYIIRKVQDFNKDKTIISLRTEDFNNLLELEMKIIDLHSKFQPLEYTIHDLRRMIELEKK